MYPGTIVEYEDRSDIVTRPEMTEVENKPLFLALFTSDKGTEAWTRVSGQDFFTMYGTHISFNKHGQPLLQAAMTINAGGELLCKRLVAPDSMLANIGIVATVGTTETQKTNDAGEPLYLDENNAETTTVTDKPVMVSSNTVSYSIKSATNVQTIEAAHDSIKASLTDGQYLLWTISDIGRGVSKKRIRIVPNYVLSRSLSYTAYNLSIMEGDEEPESMTFSINPSLIVNGQNVSLYSMAKNNSTQIEVYNDDTGIEDFVAAVAAKAGMTTEEMFKLDPLFGCSNKGIALDGYTVDSVNGADLSYTFGQSLINGSNGSFGDRPFTTENETIFSTVAIDALNGTFDTVIFNVDQYKITACVDANYPYAVKRAIEALVAFREDFHYFRDQRLGKNTLELIRIDYESEAHNKFCSTYCQSYDIFDPYTFKQIPVTICYDLAQLLVGHLDVSCVRPFAGVKYGVIIPSAIYGTLSFSPTVCPDPVGNQKEALAELRVNYASYIDNRLVVESLYTSQDKHTQWSYSNNIMAVQDLVRDIRRRCPAIRYSFLEGDDLEKYKKDVQLVIDRHAPNFKSVVFDYIEDVNYSANKIFYAAIRVQHKDFVQTEWFKIIALPNQSLIVE